MENKQPAGVSRLVGGKLYFDYAHSDSVVNSFAYGILISSKKSNTISIDQQTELEGAVSKEEVNKSVWDCGSDKSPRPDGFSALLMKWFWRFYSHNDSLWSRVIKAIYGVDGEVNKVSKYASRSCWRDIINEVRKLKDQGIHMRDFMYIKVGNDETTKFWDDIWIGSKPLKLLFPRIYALDNIKDATICMKLNEPSLDNNFCNTPNLGRSGIRVRGVLLQDQ
ncbi:hypothetical protein Tco_0047635 [Tanacetum coccineum]